MSQQSNGNGGVRELSELKRLIGAHEYEVDSDGVADAILARMRLLSRGRWMLHRGAADRVPPADAESRPGT